jgi:hypothetical protein
MFSNQVWSMFGSANPLAAMFLLHVHDKATSYGQLRPGARYAPRYAPRMHDNCQANDTNSDCYAVPRNTRCGDKLYCVRRVKVAVAERSKRGSRNPVQKCQANHERWADQHPFVTRRPHSDEEHERPPDHHRGVASRENCNDGSGRFKVTSRVDRPETYLWPQAGE